MLYFICKKCNICFLKQRKKCWYCSSLTYYVCTINNNSGNYNIYVNYHKKRCTFCDNTLVNHNNNTIFPSRELYNTLFSRSNKCNRI